MAMPPIPFEYQGQAAVTAFCAALFRAGRRFAFRPTRANGQPAFGAYLHSTGIECPGVGLYVLAQSGDRIAALHRFEAHLLPKFGLPSTLSDAQG